MTTTVNPYQAPTSDVAKPSLNRKYQPKIFTTKGRIGRLRYLAYALATYVFIIPGAIIQVLASGVGGEPSPVGSIVLLLGYIPMLVFYFIFAVRRFNDMDKSGWLSLLMILPIVNIFVGLWLIFGRGTDGENRFGPAPKANPLSVKIFGLLIPIGVVVLGIAAAIAIPAYQDYVERAQAYSSE